MAITKTMLAEKISQVTPYVIAIRRELHQCPEIKFKEEKTSTIIKRELKRMGLEVCSTAYTGIIATIEGLNSKKTVALRADMDALPLNEETSLPYSSLHSGFMHACGHDAHMAMLLGAAKILLECRDHVKGRVKLVFQPGEEGGAGAKRIVEEGHMDDVLAIFGAHVWPSLDKGKVATVAGPMMASSDAFQITIKGKGGHSALPHKAQDPMPVCFDIYNGIYKSLTRILPYDETFVLTIPKITASDAYNLIPHEVLMEGTFRTYDIEVRDRLAETIESIAKGYAKGWGLGCEVEFYKPTFPPLVNDRDLVELVFQAAFDLEIPAEIAKRTMVAEDFSFYLKKCPGAYLFLGIDTTEGYPIHHPKFNIESEDVLGEGSGLLAYLAYSFLEA